ncbi:MAG: hypothetical protein JXR52_07660 [Bacteroidales bacterium]|nr:hypothetical protein [Bacteroidales bacterium]MBN2698686.1 hypothetical protein [Bacteroidales bacterium]
MLILRLFKNNREGGIVLVILLAFLTCLITFVRSPETVEWHGMPLYNFLFGPLAGFPRLSSLLAILIHLIVCLALVRLNLRYSLIEERTFMPALFYLLIVNAFPLLHQVNPLLIGSLFYLLSFRILIDSHAEPADNYRIFHAFLVFFAGTLFYARLVWFFPVMLIILLTLRPVTLRELSYPFVAAVFTALLLLTYYWVIEDNLRELSLILQKNLNFKASLHPLHFSKYLFIGYIFFLTIISSAFIARGFHIKKIITRNIYRVLLVMFLFSLVFYFPLSGQNQGAIYFMTIPLTYLLSNYFNQKSGAFIKELFIWILIGLGVFVQITAL